LPKAAECQGSPLIWAANFLFSVTTMGIAASTASVFSLTCAFYIGISNKKDRNLIIFLSYHYITNRIIFSKPPNKNRHETH
jgi:hypothetical protein